MQRSTKVAFAAALCSLVAPVGAQAATKTVTAGPPLTKPPAGVPKDADIAQFFPAATKVHVGDTLKFKIAGFHVINFPKKGTGEPSFVIPGNGAATGVNDAAGAAFWFNGQPNLILNPAVAFGVKSGSAFDGTKDVNSGAPLSDGPPKPWSVKLTKAGTFTYFCPIHLGMKGKVTVVPKGKAVPSAAADKKAVKQQLTKALNNLKKLDKQAAPSGATITTGPDLGSGETLYRFTPSTLTVPVGTPVTLEMSAKTPEIHTFTFAKDLNSLKSLSENFIAPVGGATNGPPTLGLDPKAVYPSDAPLPAYDGSQHGDGFLNSGVLDTDPKTPQPNKTTVTFSAPGTYEYICLIHSEMKGKVVVQ